MIFLKIRLKNIYMFKDAELDLTYKSKLPSSTIEGEWLEGFPKIRFKRVCVITGANASGKTVFGKALCLINNYINGSDVNQSNNELLNLSRIMYKRNRPASFEVEFITPETNQIHLLKARFDESGLLEESYRCAKLIKSKTYGNTSSELRSSEPLSEYHRNTNNHGVPLSGFSSYAHSTGKVGVIPDWNYRFSDANSDSKTGNFIAANIKTMCAFLKAFDSSIKNVEAIGDEEYRIIFRSNETLLVDKGEIVRKNRLSRGTLEAIEIASFYKDIQSTKEKLLHADLGIMSKSRTFYLDEKLAYSHTEVEKSILNLMIENLPRHSQLFYTTHNYDVLDMNLPAHSYVFMKKPEYSEFVQPEKLGYNQNDRSLLGYVENDVFDTLPNLDSIDGLL